MFPFRKCLPSSSRVMVLMAACLTITAVWADYSTEARSFLLDERLVQYHLMGEPTAPVAILLGGGPGFSSWNLEPVQRRLAELGYHVVLMDMLGVGENERAALDAPLVAWERQIERAQAAVADNERVLLVGHSWGALMALLYTRAHPDSVERLVLLNPVDPERRAMRNVIEQIDRRRARELGEAWDDEQAWEQPMRGGEDPEVTARHQIDRSLPSYFLDYAQGRQYAGQFDVSDFSPRLNIEGWRAYRANPVEYATIRGWDVSIDFIGCRQDLLMPESLDALQANLSLAQVEVLEGCVHFPWEEVPREFAAALNRVVSGTVAGKGSRSP